MCSFDIENYFAYAACGSGWCGMIGQCDRGHRHICTYVCRISLATSINLSIISGIKSANYIFNILTLQFSMLIQDLALHSLWTKTVSIFSPAQAQKHFIKFNVIFAGLKASVKQSLKVYRFRNIDIYFKQKVWRLQKAFCG